MYNWITYLDPYDFSSIPCRVSCKELMRILHLSSLAIFDCLINDIAVTRVSIALAKSPTNRTVHTKLRKTVSMQFTSSLKKGIKYL